MTKNLYSSVDELIIQLRESPSAALLPRVLGTMRNLKSQMSPYPSMVLPQFSIITGNLNIPEELQEEYTIIIGPYFNTNMCFKSESLRFATNLDFPTHPDANIKVSACIITNFEKLEESKNEYRAVLTPVEEISCIDIFYIQLEKLDKSIKYPDVRSYVYADADYTALDNLKNNKLSYCINFFSDYILNISTPHTVKTLSGLCPKGYNIYLGPDEGTTLGITAGPGLLYTAARGTESIKGSQPIAILPYEDDDTESPDLSGGLTGQPSVH